VASLVYIFSMELHVALSVSAPGPSLSDGSDPTKIRVALFDTDSPRALQYALRKSALEQNGKEMFTRHVYL